MPTHQKLIFLIVLVHLYDVRSHPNPAPMPVVASAVQEYVLPVPDETINEKIPDADSSDEDLFYEKAAPLSVRSVSDTATRRTAAKQMSTYDVLVNDKDRKRLDEAKSILAKSYSELETSESSESEEVNWSTITPGLKLHTVTPKLVSKNHSQDFEKSDESEEYSTYPTSKYPNSDLGISNRKHLNDDQQDNSSDEDDDSSEEDEDSSEEEDILSQLEVTLSSLSKSNAISTKNYASPSPKISMIKPLMSVPETINLKYELMPDDSAVTAVSYVPGLSIPTVVPTILKSSKKPPQKSKKSNSSDQKSTKGPLMSIPETINLKYVLLPDNSTVVTYIPFNPTVLPTVLNSSKSEDVDRESNSNILSSSKHQFIPIDPNLDDDPKLSNNVLRKVDDSGTELDEEAEDELDKDADDDTEDDDDKDEEDITSENGDGTLENDDDGEDTLQEDDDEDAEDDDEDGGANDDTEGNSDSDEESESDPSVKTGAGSNGKTEENSNKKSVNIHNSNGPPIKLDLRPSNISESSSEESKEDTGFPTVEISHSLAAELCQKESSTEDLYRSYLWIRINQYVPLYSRGFSLSPPTFISSCLKWRLEPCRGTPRPPLLESCTYWAPMKLQIPRCIEPSLAKPESYWVNYRPVEYTPSNCPCKWPCEVKYDAIQKCEVQKPPAHKPHVQVMDKINDAGIPEHSLEITAHEVRQLCRGIRRHFGNFYEPTKVVSIHYLPFRIESSSGKNVETDPNKCSQWYYKPCQVDQTGSDEEEGNQRGKRKVQSMKRVLPASPTKQKSRQKRFIRRRRKNLLIQEKQRAGGIQGRTFGNEMDQTCGQWVKKSKQTDCKSEKSIKTDQVRVKQVPICPGGWPCYLFGVLSPNDKFRFTKTKECPCDWPCLPFFAAINTCYDTDGKVLMDKYGRKVVPPTVPLRPNNERGFVSCLSFMDRDTISCSIKQPPSPPEVETDDFETDVSPGTEVPNYS